MSINSRKNSNVNSVNLHLIDQSCIWINKKESIERGFEDIRKTGLEKNI